MPSVPQPPVTLDIVYEDEDLLVLNKPAGISVHASQHEPHGTLVDLLLAYNSDLQGVGEPARPGDPQRPGIVHRLDKDTSGLLVVAQNQSTFEEVKSLFQKRAVEKRYLAIVDGRIKAPRGTIDFPIGRYGIKRIAIKKEEPVRPPGQGPGQAVKVRDAVTEYIVRKRFQNATLVELRPKTGRMHQLRVHLKALGHPILGDKLYGGKLVAGRASRQMLHAAALSFARSDGGRYAFEVDPPDDFANLLGELAENEKKEYLDS